MDQAIFPIGIHCQLVAVHGDGLMRVQEGGVWCGDFNVCRKDKNDTRFMASIMMITGSVPIQHGQRWKNARGTDIGNLRRSRIPKKMRKWTLLFANV